ncbi:MAG: aspartate aminotransferase family protein [Candidatus Omnitrophica bacterium CG11_big_fil_rev_8_21_14_0_20_41_12]|nr:MAG: aspartate aminotransferase family protein [Candidatus Omnitrophica bacterium CG11_big_fil_rev_8_21_14_0_20_41_12]
MRLKQLTRISKRKKSFTHDQLLELEAKYCSWGDTVHYAEKLNIFKSSAGSYLYDHQGREYLDLQMWYSAVNFGYGNQRLNEALKKQIDTLPQLACQYLHEEKIQLSTKLAQRNQRTFEEKGRVHFNVGGASALEDSLKLVRNYSGRSLVFAFMGGYHGRTLGASAITSSFRYRERFGHFGDRAMFVPYPYCFRCLYDKKRDFCDLYCLKQFERLFETEYYSVVNKKNNKCEFAAFYVEPVQGTGGYIVPPQEYYSELKNILDRYGILLIDDEIQMGFFRTGKFWAIEHFNITPDIIVFGKALTNGLNPLSGVWAKEKFISPDVFPPGSTHATFSSNSLGTTVGLEVVKLIEESDFAISIPKKGRYFISQLKKLQKKYPQIADVDGIGLALRMEICEKDGYTPNKELTDRIVNLGLSGSLNVRGKRRGLILDVGGYYKNVFTIAPSFYITEEEIDLGVELFGEALKRALKKS